MTNNVDPDRTAPIGVVCSGSTLLASILNLSVMLGNYLQQTIQQTKFSDAFFSWLLNHHYFFVLKKFVFYIATYF